MRYSMWICLLVTSMLLIAWLVLFGWAIPKVIIDEWPPCEDMSECGTCEIMLRPGYLMLVCEQNFNCTLLNADPPVNQLPAPMNIQALYCGNQLALYRRKAWSDCNGDNAPDCECWTWYWRDKYDPKVWYIGLEPCE